MYSSALMLWVGLSCIEQPVGPSDLMRFPAPWVAEASYRFSLQHFAWVTREMTRTKREAPWELGAWLAWEEEARHYRECWFNLLTAHGKPDDSESWREVRLGNMRELRRLIGREAYDRGEMPPPAPWHRFRRR